MTKKQQRWVWGGLFGVGTIAALWYAYTRVREVPEILPSQVKWVE